MTPPARLHQILRVRCKADLEFLRDGLADEAMINANLLENDPASTAAVLQQTTLPITIDPVLYRFQQPEWWRNDKGRPKRNFRRLGASYSDGTGIDLPAGPLIDTVPNQRAWRSLARNVVDYQHSRLQRIPTQLDLFAPTEPRHLYAARVTAPALVAHSHVEDSINRLLAEASAEASSAPVTLPVIVPPERITDGHELDVVLRAVPTDGVGSYLIWTPEVNEERLLREPELLAAVLRLVATLAERGIPVGHLHGGYVLAALHELGLAAVAHTFSWTDSTEPAVKQGGGGPRSCRTYVPGVRHCLPFSRAHWLGRPLGQDEYARAYCDCAFCAGAFDKGIHPLDLLLEEHEIDVGRVRRSTPTPAATKLNTWHFLFSRRQEIDAFSNTPASEVIFNDIERARLLADHDGAERLRRVAGRLRIA